MSQVLNEQLRELIAKGDATEDEIRELANRIVVMGGRLNPTARPLPPGNVIVAMPGGRFEQRRPAAARILQRGGHGRILRTAADLVWALFGTEPPEEIMQEEDVFPDPGRFNPWDLLGLVETINDLDVLDEMLRREEGGQGRGPVLQLLKARSEALGVG